jgi:hypothetical protein
MGTEIDVKIIQFFMELAIVPFSVTLFLLLANYYHPLKNLEELDQDQPTKN